MKKEVLILWNNLFILAYCNPYFIKFSLHLQWVASSIATHFWTTSSNRPIWSKERSQQIPFSSRFFHREIWLCIMQKWYLQLWDLIPTSFGKDPVKKSMDFGVSMVLSCKASNDINWCQSDVNGCLLILIDVNADVNSMSIRCQLMSNISHHLKTT